MLYLIGEHGYEHGMTHFVIDEEAFSQEQLYHLAGEFLLHIKLPLAAIRSLHSEEDRIAGALDPRRVYTDYCYAKDGDISGKVADYEPRGVFKTWLKKNKNINVVEHDEISVWVSG